MEGVGGGEGVEGVGGREGAGLHFVVPFGRSGGGRSGKRKVG